MTYQTVLVERSQLPILRVTLNRPEKRNAIGPTLVRELREVVTAFRDDAHAQVLVLTGAGDYFSAGADLSEMSGSGAIRPPAGWPELLCAFHETGKPIIAKVNGPALAGGLGLMLACDLVVAADTAKFGTTEVRVGLWPMMITAEIVRNIGRKRALELMLTGKTIDAARAEQIGLVNQVVPAAELEAETLALATTLTQRSPAVMAAGLRAFYAVQDEDYRPALRKLEAELNHVLSLEDAREGLLAFVQKRPPVWKGR